MCTLRHPPAFWHSLCGEQRKKGILRWSGVKLSFSMEPYSPSEPNRPRRTEAAFFCPREGGKQFVIEEFFGMARDWDISLLNVIIALNSVDRKWVQRVWKARWLRKKFPLCISKNGLMSMTGSDNTHILLQKHVWFLFYMSTDVVHIISSTFKWGRFEFTLFLLFGNESSDKVLLLLKWPMCRNQSSFKSIWRIKWTKGWKTITVFFLGEIGNCRWIYTFVLGEFSTMSFYRMPFNVNVFFLNFLDFNNKTIG